MSWRVILRVGMTQDTESVVRNKALVPRFEAIGLRNTATGTWETNFATAAQAATELASILDTLSNPSAVIGADPNVRLKHLWVYIDDQPDPPSAPDEDA